MSDYIEHDYKTIDLYKDVSDEDWNNWHWQLKNVIRDIPTLKKIMNVDASLEANLEKCLEKFKMAITPYYASIMERPLYPLPFPVMWQVQRSRPMQND